MSANKIDAVLLTRMFLAGARNLNIKKDWINELNVFPVPDGDTGTNMTMTVMSAVTEISGTDQTRMKDVSKAISSGSLRGARGNSGVILSQLFRGFSKVVKGEDELDTALLAAAAERAVETAYKAVMKPKEGTILTVAKGMADKARELADREEKPEMDVFLQTVVDYGNEVLAKTPEMLPVLKEAGVVDSGGQGLMAILEGALDAFLGKEIPDEFTPPEKETPAEEQLRYTYGVAYVLHAERNVPQAAVDELYAFLSSVGEIEGLQPDHERVFVQLKTDDPGIVLTKGMSVGYLTDILVRNLRQEDTEWVLRKPAAPRHEPETPAEPPKEVGMVAVAAGSGFREIFAGLDVDCVIEGGQTMNPSTEDVINAVDQVNAHNVFLFPNNKNIILAANQARELVQEKNVIVIPTKTIPQGISAIISYDPSLSVEANQETMKNVIGSVRTSEITYAIRDTHIDDREIHEGDIMAVGDDGIIAVGSGIEAVALESVSAMMNPEAALISVYAGADYPEEKAEALGEQLRSAYPDCDVEVSTGGQPVYYCILSVE